MFLLSFFRSAFSENGRKRSYYAAYTVIFCAVSLFCFSWFIAAGKTFIWNNDGWHQHFQALVYYAQYLRTIIRHLLYDHALIIPDWDFYIGEGSDIFNTLHYYVIGDPFALLSVFVPTRYMQYFYSFSCVLRLYLSGLAFSALCFGTGQRSRYGIMAGSVGYCFCDWMLTNVARHPFFLNPMIWFPLMILGVEKVIRKEKPYLFIAASALSAASNFYFFYMIAILTVLYALIRLGTLYRRSLREGFLTLMRLGVMAVMGVCIAGIILLPAMMAFLNDSRISVSQPFHWFYPLSYYSQLPAAFIADRSSFWLFIGISAPAVPALFLLLLRKKEDRLLKILLLTCFVIMLFPIGGRLLNGMSYMSNRWVWAFVLLCMYVLVRKWDALLSLPRKEWKRLFLCCCLYFAVCLLCERSHFAVTFAAVCLMFVTLFVIREDPAGRRNSVLQQALLLLLVALGVVNVAYWKYSPSSSDYASGFTEYREVENKWKNNEAAVVKAVTKYPYTRMTGRSLTGNANITREISSTKYFWSISNPFVNRYRDDLAMIDPLYSNYMGYDDRTTPIALAGVQYYVDANRSPKGIPYGFSLIGTYNADPSEKEALEALKKELGTETLTDEQLRKIKNDTTNSVSVFINQYALPIAYCYDACFSEDVWASLDPVQKQESLLEAAYIDTDAESLSSALAFVQPDVPDFTVPFDVTCSGDEITLTGNGFITTANNAKVTLTLLADSTNSETYVGFEGLEFTSTSEYDLYFGDESADPLDLYNRTNWKLLPSSAKRSVINNRLYWNPVQNPDIVVTSPDGTRKVIDYYQPDEPFSVDRHDFIANLGYAAESPKSITITLPLRGVYSFDSLKVYRVPMDGYPEKIEKLKQNTLEDLRFGNDSVTGEISLSDPRILCLAINYAAGWKAYIDDKETEVHCLNGRYLGIVIPEGRHSVRFLYEPPYKCAGFAVSAAGCSALAVMLILDRRKNKTSKRGKTDDPDHRS